jgi:hypothetical protein
MVGPERKPPLVTALQKAISATTPERTIFEGYPHPHIKVAVAVCQVAALLPAITAAQAST